MRAGSFFSVARTDYRSRVKRAPPTQPTRVDRISVASWIFNISRDPTIATCIPYH